MKHKSFKHRKKRQFPSHSYLENQKQFDPEPSPKYPEWLAKGSHDFIFMDEITVYYSLN